MFLLKIQAFYKIYRIGMVIATYIIKVETIRLHFIKGDAIDRPETPWIVYR